MALTKAQVREILSKAGVTPENMADAVESIISGHVTSIEALREKVGEGENAVKKLAELEKENEDLKKQVTEPDAYKSKYTELKDEFEKFKSDIDSKEAMRRKETAYRSALKEAGVSDKVIDNVLKVSKYSELELDEEGKIKETEKVIEDIKKEWAGFIVKSGESGTDTHNPPPEGEPEPKTVPSFF